jgi:hypothetical protein
MAYPPNTFATKPAGNVAASLLDQNFQAAAPLDSPIFTGTPAAPTPPNGDSSTRLATTAFVTGSGVVPFGYIAGLILSNDLGSPDTVLDISAGQATDSTNTITIVLGAFTKTTGGTWVAGTGNAGMGQGLTIASTTWYHVFAIINSGASDAYFDTSVSAANRPTGTTVWRRVGSFLTDGASKIIAFIQNGESFRWVTPVKDVNGTVPGVTTRVTATLTVPAGVVVFPDLVAVVTAGATGVNLLLTSLNETDSTPAVGLNDQISNVAGQPSSATTITTVHTNTSSQIGYRVTTVDSAVNITTYGWVDTRGRDL